VKADTAAACNAAAKAADPNEAAKADSAAACPANRAANPVVAAPRRARTDEAARIPQDRVVDPKADTGPEQARARKRELDPPPARQGPGGRVLARAARADPASARAVPADRRAALAFGRA
jgi:hypothetical protein